MPYRELSPPTRLHPTIACLWWSAGTPRPVLPDGCVDLVWTGGELVVAGPATHAMVPAVKSDAVKLGVRFRIGAAGALLRLPARALCDEAPPAREALANGRELEQRTGNATDDARRLQTLVEAVGSFQRDSQGCDPLAWAAARRLEQGVRVSALGAELGISERQLRRRFDEAVGYSPKTLARVLRFQRFLRAASRDTNLGALAAQAGYADQAHLTRDCRELSGTTPARLLATGARAAGDPLIAT